MQLATLLATYQPGLDGDFQIAWDPSVDGFIHSTLAELAEVYPAYAFCIKIESAVIPIRDETVRLLWEPSNDVMVLITYRINNLPATFKVKLPFYAGDIVSLEPVNAPKPAPLPC